MCSNLFARILMAVHAFQCYRIDKGYFAMADTDYRAVFFMEFDNVAVPFTSPVPPIEPD
jgi:hypothetical protein